MSLKSWIIWHGKDIGYGLLSRVLWPRSSAAALVMRDSKVLGIDTGDYIMLPGGGLKRNESFEDAVIRETREETGYLVETVNRVSERINSVGGVETIFTAKVVGGETDRNWEGSPVWLSPEEVEEVQWRHGRNVSELIQKHVL